MSLKFPARYTFNLLRNTQTGEQKVTASHTSNQKVTLENIKYDSVKHFSWNAHEKVALLSVKEISSEEELLKVFEDLRVWEVNLSI